MKPTTFLSVDYGSPGRDETVLIWYHQMPARISGRKADHIIIDDILNTESTMLRSSNPPHGAWLGEGFQTQNFPREQKPKKVDYNTVGVRFLDGHSLAKVYTYGIRKGGKVHLGQELIADTQRGPALVVVVRIDAKPAPVDPSWPCGLKFLTRKAVPL